jgi:hypothetical protein
LRGRQKEHCACDRNKISGAWGLRPGEQKIEGKYGEDEQDPCNLSYIGITELCYVSHHTERGQSKSMRP